jgi:outer membrane protein assembly factor BamB
MLVCLDTATGQELWRRYDMPEGVCTVGDDGVVAMLRDDDRTVELLSPLDGQTLRTYESEYSGGEWIRHWGRMALAATGQPLQGTVLNPVAPEPGTSSETVPPANGTPTPEPRELHLKMVDLAGPKTLWERTFPPGSAAFEVDEDWLGVISSDGALCFLDVQTGQTVRQSTVTVPRGVTQIATAVTERSIFVTLSPPVTEDALTGSKPMKLKHRQFYVNGPVHAFDRRTGEHQWSQQIENRVFPIDQVRDVPLLICADVWKGPLDPMPEVGQVFPKLDDESPKADDADALRVRYWVLDSRTGRVVLNTAVNKSQVQYTVERDLAKGWVELRQGGANYRFSYDDVGKAEK